MARLVDDAQVERRDPGHSDIGFQIQRAGLKEVDPIEHGQKVGKAKHVRAVLGWALEHDPQSGELLVAHLLAVISSCGGFRESSSNYVGAEAILNARDAFKKQGYSLSMDGQLLPSVLENLSIKDLEEG